MTERQDASLRTVVCDLSSAEVLEEILISPWGWVDSLQGKFLMDDLAATETIQTFNAHRVDLPVDWEHQTLGGRYSSPDGRSPAAGWIKTLISRPGKGLFGRISWTVQGRADLTSRKYRYLSPVIYARRLDGRAVELHSVALTNKPAIRGMTAVVNKGDTTRKANVMNEYDRLLGELRTTLGLDASADEAAVLTAVRQVVSGGPSANSDGRIDVTRFVARADYDIAMKRGSTAENEILAMKADAFLCEGERAGKISCATKDHWLRAFSENPDMARKHLAMEPQRYPAAGRLINPGRMLAEGRGNRLVIINKAAHEWDGSRTLMGLTNRSDYINDGLRQAGLGRLSEEETKTLA